MDNRVTRILVGLLGLGTFWVSLGAVQEPTTPAEWALMLRKDKRLEAKYEYKFDDTRTMDEVLDILSKLAKVPLRIANPPKEGKIVVFAGQSSGLVFAHMQSLAERHFNDGKWEKDGDGYVLAGKPKNVWTPKDFADEVARKKADDAAKTTANLKARAAIMEMLKKDERLHVRVEVKSARSDATLQELFDVLEKATKVPLRLADPPKEGKPLCGNAGVGPAYMFMAGIATNTVTDGRWEKDGDGYKLHGKPTRMLSPEDEAKAIAFKKKYEEALAKRTADLAKQFPLRADAKLQRTFTFNEKEPDLRELLNRLDEATDLRFTLADNLAKHDPYCGVVLLGLVPAWRVMDFIAERDLENGKWVKTADGYRLEGVSISSRPAPKNAKDVQVLWESLAHSKDPSEPRRIIGGLIAAPEVTLAFTREHLKPVSGPDEKTFRELHSRLLSKDDAVREAALQELPKFKLNEGTLYILENNFNRDPQLKTLIADIKAKRAKVIPQPSRTLGAITVLEKIGNAEARRQLEVLAEGAYGATLTQQARAAIARLQKGASAK